MKKLFLILLISPILLSAQIIPNLKAPYWEPAKEFYIDTGYFHQGYLEVNSYRSDNDNNLFLYNVQYWQTENGKFNKIVSISTTPEKYFYSERHFKFIGDRPFVIEEYKKENEKSMIKLDSKDSLVFKNNLIIIKHKNIGRKYNYERLYQYDSIMGLISTSVRLKEKLPEEVNNNYFKVISFYMPNFPAIVYEYKLSKKGQFLDKKTFHYYDSFGRITASLDSIVDEDSMRLLGSTQAFYQGNTALIDSIIFNNTLNNLVLTYRIEYDACNKVSKVFKFCKTGSQPIKLVERFDVKVIKPSVYKSILKVKEVNISNTHQNPKKKTKSRKTKR